MRVRAVWLIAEMVSLCAAVALMLMLSAAVGHAEGDQARTLVKRVLDSGPEVPFVAKLKLSTEGGLARDLELRHKRLGDAEVSYMEVTSPLDVKDTRFLFFERTEGRDEQFIYVPAFKRVMQVADDVRKQPFLGSEFYVSDLVAPDLIDFTFGFVGEEKVGGRDCKLVEVLPKTPANEIYGKAVLAIDPADRLILRTEFFGRDGKPLKVWTIEKLDKIDGNWTPLRQKMANVREKTDSHLEITEIKYGVEVPDETFNRVHLMR